LKFWEIQTGSSRGNHPELDLWPPALRKRPGWLKNTTDIRSGLCVSVNEVVQVSFEKKLVEGYCQFSFGVYLDGYMEMP
jgi:hypothetical protein